jgi:hypothetical protein
VEHRNLKPYFHWAIIVLIGLFMAAGSPLMGLAYCGLVIVINGIVYFNRI